MKKFSDLIEVFNFVMFMEATTMFTIKKKVYLSITPYEDRKVLVSFDYGKDLNFLFDPAKVSEEEIQSMYWQVKSVASRCWNR